MMTSNPKPTRRGSAGAVFIIAWIAVIALALALTGLGIALTGGAASFREWLVAVTPYALVWHGLVYIVGSTLYITRFRPRLRARQRRQADGGEAARVRLVAIERMLVVMLVVLEVSNLPDLIAWVQG